MTSRSTDGDRKPQAEKPDLAGFADFNRRDSYSIPAINADGGAGSPRVQHRVSKRQLVEISSRLSERDFEILHSVQRHRYLLSTQAQRLHFTEAATSTAALRATNRSLKKLKELGLIDSLVLRCINNCELNSQWNPCICPTECMRSKVVLLNEASDTFLQLIYGCVALPF